MNARQKNVAIIAGVLLVIASPYPAFLVGEYLAEELPRAINERPVSMLVGFLVNAAIVIAFFGYSLFVKRQQAK